MVFPPQNAFYHLILTTTLRGRCHFAVEKVELKAVSDLVSHSPSKQRVRIQINVTHWYVASRDRVSDSEPHCKVVSGEELGKLLVGEGCQFRALGFCVIFPEVLPLASGLLLPLQTLASY